MLVPGDPCLITEDFAFRTVAPEAMMLEVPGRRIELRRERPMAITLLAMTIDAGAFARIGALPLSIVWGRSGKGSSTQASASLSAGNAASSHHARLPTHRIRHRAAQTQHPHSVRRSSLCHVRTLLMDGPSSPCPVATVRNPARPSSDGTA